MKDAYVSSNKISQLSSCGRKVIAEAGINTEEVAIHAEKTFQFVASLEARTSRITLISTVIGETAGYFLAVPVLYNFLHPFLGQKLEQHLNWNCGG